MVGCQFLGQDNHFGLKQKQHDHYLHCSSVAESQNKTTILVKKKPV